MSIGTRIREMRQANRLTLQQVADVFGISRSSVSDWESGKTRPDTAKLRQLAETLQTTVDYLLGENKAEINRRYNEQRTAGSLKPQEAYRPRRSESLPAAGTVAVPESNSNVTGLDREADKLPVITWVQAGEWGTPMQNLENVEEWVVCPFPHSKNSFVLKVSGRSMFNPDGDQSFRDGEYISVDADREAAHGSFVIATTGEEATVLFRQLHIESDGARTLFALNPNWKERYVQADEHTRIVGVVTGQWRPLI